MKNQFFLWFGCLVGTLAITPAQIIIDSFDAGPFTVTGGNAMITIEL